MGGNGTIGGGGSVVFDFNIKQSGGGPTTPPKQQWKGTDPDSATGGNKSKVTVTFLKPPTSLGNNKYEVEVAQNEGDVIKISWT